MPRASAIVPPASAEPLCTSTVSANIHLYYKLRGRLMDDDRYMGEEELNSKLLDLLIECLLKQIGSIVHCTKLGEWKLATSWGS